MFSLASMKAVVVATAILSFVSGVTSCDKHKTRDLGATPSSDIPFYLQVDSYGNTYAIIYYGVMGDKSKEIKVPCFGEVVQSTTHSGPTSMSCHCATESECTLQVPYVFERDPSGAIVSVSYHPNKADDTVLVVNFRPLKDANGVTIGAVFDDAEETPILVVPFESHTDENGETVTVIVDRSKSNHGSTKCIVFWMLGLVSFFILMAYLTCKLRSRSASQRITTVEPDSKGTDDDGTEVGSTTDEA